MEVIAKLKLGYHFLDHKSDPCFASL